MSIYKCLSVQFWDVSSIDEVSAGTGLAVYEIARDSLLGRFVV